MRILVNVRSRYTRVLRISRDIKFEERCSVFPSCILRGIARRNKSNLVKRRNSQEIQRSVRLRRISYQKERTSGVGYYLVLVYNASINILTLINYLYRYSALSNLCT